MPLKPSLVEWKPSEGGSRGEGDLPLETFLGGMETISISTILLNKITTLKPSLVEWKHFNQ